MSIKVQLSATAGNFPLPQLQKPALIGALDATAGFYGLITFGPVYLVRIRHFPATDMSYVLSGGALIGAVCAIVFAIDSDRRKRRAWYGFGLFVAGAIFLTAELFLGNAAAAAIALALASAARRLH